MLEKGLNVALPQLAKLLGLKGGRGLDFWSDLVPIIDVSAYLQTPDTMDFVTASKALAIADYNAAPPVFTIAVPQSEVWTVYLVGSWSGPLAADQQLSMQTCIVHSVAGTRLSFSTDITGGRLLGTAASPLGPFKGGVGQYFPQGLRLMPGDEIGIQLASFVGGVSLTIATQIAVQRMVQKL
jgi:hypothetical protein